MVFYDSNWWGGAEIDHFTGFIEIIGNVCVPPVILTLNVAMNNKFLIMFYSAIEKTITSKFDIQCQISKFKAIVQITLELEPSYFLGEAQITKASI